MPGAVADPIYSLDNLSALHVIASLISENGGHPVTVGERGLLASGLPRLPNGVLAALRLNDWIETAQVGGGTRVGLGPRARSVAAEWGIPVPPATADAHP